MLILSKEAMDSVLSLRGKLTGAVDKEECIADTEKMIEIKESHLCRADWGSCCGTISGLPGQIDSEIGMLRTLLETLRESDKGKAIPLLDNYIRYLKDNYQTEYPSGW